MFFLSAFSFWSFTAGEAAAVPLQRQLQEHYLNQSMVVNWADIKI